MTNTDPLLDRGLAQQIGYLNYFLRRYVGPTFCRLFGHWWGPEVLVTKWNIRCCGNCLCTELKSPVYMLSPPMTKDCKHPAWEKFYSNDALTTEPWRCVNCGASKPKRPSYIIRERAEEILKERFPYEAPGSHHVVLATLEYLDQLAGFPKSHE